MAENQSEASCFPSRYGGNNVTPANYIVEVICERIALKDKLGALPMKFWALPKWKKIYMMQLLAANSLLKMYSPRAILAGLKKHPKCYSLRAQWLDDSFKEEQEKLDKLQVVVEEALPAQTEPEVVVTGSDKPREAFSHQKSIKAKLRDLD